MAGKMRIRKVLPNWRAFGWQIWQSWYLRFSVARQNLRHPCRPLACRLTGPNCEFHSDDHAPGAVLPGVLVVGRRGNA